jgi:hypothetical protein
LKVSGEWERVPAHARLQTAVKVFLEYVRNSRDSTGETDARLEAGLLLELQEALQICEGQQINAGAGPLL